MCQLGSCSLYCNTVTQLCHCIWSMYTKQSPVYVRSRLQQRWPISQTIPQWNCPDILLCIVEPLWNHCGTHQANHSTVEPFPNWLNPLYTHWLQLFLSSSLLVNYSTAAAAPACLMLFSREELGRQTMLAHSRVPSTLTNELPPSTTTILKSPHHHLTIAR